MALTPTMRRRCWVCHGARCSEGSRRHGTTMSLLASEAVVDEDMSAAAAA